jgi:ABC-type uncharacterized transport system auxiliary subunit
MPSIPIQSLCTVLIVSIAGCLSAGEYVPIQRFALNGNLDIASVPSTNLTVGVRPLEYVRFYKEPMVYRQGDYAIAYDAYHHWAELPRDAVTRVLIDGLTETEGFADAGYAYALPRPDFIVTGELRRFDQMRSTEPWTAVCEARFEIRDRSTGAVRWSETLSAEAELPSQDAAGFAAAMSQAVGELVTNAVERIVAHATDS